MPKDAYKDSYCQEVVELMSQGMFDIEIAAKWDINEKTFRRWKTEKQEFGEAYELGFPKCEAWWLAFMRKMMMEGNDKGFKYCIGIMNNKFKWNQEGKSGTTNNIQIGNMNVLNTKSEAELIELAQEKIKKLGLDKVQEVLDVTAIIEPQNDSTK